MIYLSVTPLRALSKAKEQKTEKESGANRQPIKEQSRAE